MTATTVVKTWAMLFSKADGIAQDKILFSKLLDVSEVFETFMYPITSHKKQRAKYQRNSSQEVKLGLGGFFDPRPFTLDPRLVTLDPRPSTKRQTLHKQAIEKYRRVKFESNEKRHETLLTHRRVFNIYLHKLPFTCIMDFTDNKTPIVVPVGCIGLWKHHCVLSEFGKIKEIGKI